jgi:tRNA/tmRNA/rRNA uracil-C5-methylase (TrmA/RlmC/RlmD family)
LGDAQACARTWGGAAEVALAVAPGQAQPIAFIDGAPAGKRIRVLERAAGRDWRVTGPGFWQVHPAAADTLAGAVLAALAPRPGEGALDLYSGVGLFAGVVAEAVGPTGAVVAVESSEPACKDARRNLHDLPQVRIAHARVDAWLRSDEAAALGGVDVVVLDPPRSGAGRGVVEAIAARAGRAIAYVACDPAALARDLATFAALGWRLDSLRAYDAFPMTHHVECVAGLVRGTVS